MKESTCAGSRGPACKGGTGPKTRQGQGFSSHANGHHAADVAKGPHDAAHAKRFGHGQSGLDESDSILELTVGLPGKNVRPLLERDIFQVFEDGLGVVAQRDRDVILEGVKLVL